MAENRKPTGANGGSNENLSVASNSNKENIAKNTTAVNPGDDSNPLLPGQALTADWVCDFMRMLRADLRGFSELHRHATEIVQACDRLRDEIEEERALYEHRTRLMRGRH